MTSDSTGDRLGQGVRPAILDRSAATMAIGTRVGQGVRPATLDGLTPRKSPMSGHSTMLWRALITRSADKVGGITLRNIILRKRCTGSSPDSVQQGTPKRKASLVRVRRSLFPVARKRVGVLLFSWIKNWRERMGTSKALPQHVQVGLRIPWEPQVCPLCECLLTTGKTAFEHMRRLHKSRRLFFICTKCSGTYSAYSRITTHYPKCGNRRAVPEVMSKYACSLCVKAFASQRGLTIHRRSKHAEVYFQELRSAGSPKKRPRGLWGAKDLTFLAKLLKERGGAPGFYSEAQKHLGTFTRQQIVDKCKQLKKRSSKHPTAPQGAQGGGTLDLSWLREPLPPLPSVSGARLILGEALAPTAKAGHISPLTATLKSVNIYVKRMVRLMTRGKVTPYTRRFKSQPLKRTKRDKISCYKSLQDLFKKDKSGAARWILDGKIKTTCPVDPVATERAYKNIWEAHDDFQDLGQFGLLPAATNGVLYGPITPLEVLATIRKMKKSGAPGPDGVKRDDLLRWDSKGTKLASLYNTILYNGTLPKRLKGSRTTLIPKTTEPGKLSDLNNWRPITVGSVILRVFSGILNRRLTDACPVHVRQRGFLESPGCSENLCVLGGIMQMSKREKKPLAVVFIDFAKAFDSVSHRHIQAVLARRQVDELFQQLIHDSYKGCFTKVRSGGGETTRIMLKRGVKQGDPLSPLLFNLAVDPLLYALERHGEGFEVKGLSVTSLAFADDLVLLSNSWQGMARNLAILEKFCEATGLKVNPSKCHSFMIEASGTKRYRINNCVEWSLSGAPIHLIKEHEAEKYLGVSINPWKGIVKPPLRSMVRDMLAKLSGVPLKSFQRLEILKVYALPRTIYIADHGRVGKALLSECDRDIRSQVKKWLHLEPSTADGLLYASPKDGGLGIVRLAKHIPAIQFRRLLKLYNSTDECTRTIARATVPLSELRKLWSIIQDGIPAKQAAQSFEEVEVDASAASTRVWRKAEFSRWCRLGSQGNGVIVFHEDKISNAWLRDICSSNKMSTSEKIIGLKLRTNIVPTVSTVWKHKQVSVNQYTCRLCRMKKETLKHIVGKCAILKRNRMTRHNKICKLMRLECERLGWTVVQEKRLSLPSGEVGVPDLIMRRGTSAMMLDIAVPFETSLATLEDAERAKTVKYRKFAGAVMNLFPGVNNVYVRGFPVGARGKWHRHNNHILRLLGMTKARINSFAKLVSRRALLQTVDMCKVFRSLARSPGP